MTETKTFRPGGARVVAYVVGLILLVVTFVVGLSLPEEIGFSFSQFVTLWLIIFAVLWMLHGVGRSFVRATDEGVEVLNGYRRHQIAWTDVEGFAMNTGAPWPTLVTTDDERIMLFGIQSSDGAVSRQAVEYLRGRLS